jgi:RimJ/RimL family protein N-acetyltransferase
MVLNYDADAVWAFLRRRMPGLARADDSVVFGLERDGKIVAAVVFEGINRFHLWMHMAVESGAFVGRDFIRCAFVYAFRVCDVQRVRGYVEASNLAARRIDERLGFREDAKLEGAAKDGGDVIVYAMRRSECRFLED